MTGENYYKSQEALKKAPGMHNEYDLYAPDSKALVNLKPGQFAGQVVAKADGSSKPGQEYNPELAPDIT